MPYFICYTYIYQIIYLVACNFLMRYLFTSERDLDPWSTCRDMYKKWSWYVKPSGSAKSSFKNVDTEVSSSSLQALVYPSFTVKPLTFKEVTLFDGMVWFKKNRIECFSWPMEESALLSWVAMEGRLW